MILTLPHPLVSRATSYQPGSLAEQAKILFAEAEENNLDIEVLNKRIKRWEKCGLCEQEYHGVVKCALAWACWKTYFGGTHPITTSIECTLRDSRAVLNARETPSPGDA